MRLTLIFAAIGVLACLVMMLKIGRNFLDDRDKARRRHMDSC